MDFHTLLVSVQGLKSFPRRPQAKSTPLALSLIAIGFFHARAVVTYLQTQAAAVVADCDSYAAIARSP